MGEIEERHIKVQDLEAGNVKFSHTWCRAIRKYCYIYTTSLLTVRFILIDHLRTENLLQNLKLEYQRWLELLFPAERTVTVVKSKSALWRLRLVFSFQVTLIM